MALLSCGYRNASDRMVILRCCGPQEYYLERVVFPFELLSFSAPKGCEVEIWTHDLGGPSLLETIAVGELIIEEQLNEPSELDELVAEGVVAGGLRG
ncbi:DUF1830 domain-containing protein [Cyanobium sp. Morenito 9A2]|uniref:DUF1830 domain-containing protein n=1 Tax=Cyanobium sp. Morenito 9A2 TaxID=2823718 RepID=UPI0020CD35D7|nr:DUF1830 domain-containing protein [Cyanobium sp. Morenito 9A2]MCP9850129.1 DUF1830 domain-containing protein [Cyanobium sp. Morenito 9A2]